MTSKHRKPPPIYEHPIRTPAVVNDQTLGSGNLRMAVMLPVGENENEWIAFHLVDFFKQITMLYGTILPYCTDESCPTMSAGQNKYFWTENGKSVIMSASEYVDKLMTWVSELIDDESVFPSLLNKPFSANFKAICSDIVRRLFRVYAHIYIDHIHHIRNPMLDEEAHLNTSFRHFILFAQEFQLIPINELAPLQKIIDRLTKH